MKRAVGVPNARLSKPTVKPGTHRGKVRREERKGMKSMIRIREFLLLGLVAIGLAVMTGCQTAEGFGDDVQDAGDSIEDSLD
jgi:predicted small secreted protein